MAAQLHIPKPKVEMDRYELMQLRKQSSEAIWEEDTERWVLPAGTLVKHGTSTNNILRKLEEGITPKGPDHGVHVASCYMAYATSFANYSFAFEDAFQTTADEMVERCVELQRIIMAANEQQAAQKDCCSAKV